MIKDRPHRLDLVYFHSPLFLVTFCTRNRTKIPSLHLAQGAIENYARIGIHDFNIAIGRYVIMPDHVHLFVRGDHNFCSFNVGWWTKASDVGSHGEAAALATWIF